MVFCMRIHVKYMFIAFICFSFSCQKDETFYELNLTENSSKVEGEVILQPEVGKDHFFDLTADKNFFYSLYENEKGNGMLAVYDKDFTLRQEQCLFNISMNTHPHFTHEVVHDILHIASNHSQIWQLQLDGKKFQSKVLDTNWTNNGVDYNVISPDEFWISTTQRMWRSSFFRLIDGRCNWFVPDSTIGQLYPNSVPFIAHLSVNGKQEKAVATYRFIDFLSFYDFNGELKCSVKIQSKFPPSEIQINDPNTIKYFIDLYGTDQSVYCLYSGSNNLDVPARIIQFDWNGRHIRTYLLDRPVYSFAVNEAKHLLVAISNNKSNKQQEIVKYILK